jgi:peptide chain release factor 2
MRYLRAKLLEEEERKRAETMAAERGEQKAVEWGSQIRSYTLHPSQRVKDHRTGFEMGDANRVLDGDLDGFIREYLVQHAGES